MNRSVNSIWIYGIISIFCWAFNWMAARIYHRDFSPLSILKDIFENIGVIIFSALVIFVYGFLAPAVFLGNPSPDELWMAALVFAPWIICPPLAPLLYFYAFALWAGPIVTIQNIIRLSMNKNPVELD